MTTVGSVSVIGLGDMGSVLASILLQRGYSVTVWNRTTAKADQLVKDGAKLADSPTIAVKASPIIIICVANYETSWSILGSEDTAAALAGKLLIQLSTGTPNDARDGEAWAKERGADYLDGAIIATPSQMGKPESPIFISGPQSAFQKSEAILKTLAGNIQYMGEGIGSGSAWDLAFLSVLWGSMVGFLHSARIFESEGLPVNAFGGMVEAIAPILGSMLRHEGEVIHTNSFDKPQSSVNVSALSVDLIAKQASEAKINADFPLFAQALFRKAQAAGYGKEEVGALIKVIRD